MNKKAISPVISTVFMIVFALLLGVIVMSWGAEYEAMENRDCGNVVVGVVEIGGKAQVCYTSEKIEFTIENNGESAFSGVKAILIGDDVTSAEVSISLDPADVKKGFFVPESMNNPTAIKFIPKIGDELCASGSVTVDLRRCPGIEVI